jgi:5-hydroxyisourate hydrolase-like protein (transthyretin family)
MLASSSLSTTVTTDKTTYVAGDNVMSINTTTLGTQPLAGASVTFTITKPNGVTTTQTSTTDANGRAGYKWRLNKQKDPSGSYQVRTVATSQGKSVSATTSFTVR